MTSVESDGDISQSTKMVAGNVFADGSLATSVRDALGPIFEVEELADLVPRLGQAVEGPDRLALATA